MSYHFVSISGFLLNQQTTHHCRSSFCFQLYLPAIICSVCLPQWQYCLVLSVFSLGEGVAEETSYGSTVHVSYMVCRLRLCVYRFILLPFYSFVSMWDIAEVVCVRVHSVLIRSALTPSRGHSRY